MSDYDKRTSYWRERLADADRTAAKRLPRGLRRRLIKVYVAPGYPSDPSRHR